MSAGVWVVMGEAGSYDDHHEWTVAAYSTEERARRHQVLAQKAADILSDFKVVHDVGGVRRVSSGAQGVNPYDPLAPQGDMSDYFVVWVPAPAEPPSEQEVTRSKERGPYVDTDAYRTRRPA